MRNTSLHSQRNQRCVRTGRPDAVDSLGFTKYIKETCKTEQKQRKLPSIRSVSQSCVFVQVNLMQYMKLSTSRDFRINAATLDAALQEQDDSDEVSAACRTVTSSSS